MRQRVTWRLSIAMVVVASITLVGAQWQRASAATVTAVAGSAFAASAQNITIFAGPQTPYGPKPLVTLPAGGSATAITGMDASEGIAYGPATLFTSGPSNVSTQGSSATGSVTSLATLTKITNANGETMTADSLGSTCTASATGNTASTTVTNGVVDTLIDETTTPETIVSQPIPTNPMEGLTVNGTLVISPSDTETYTWVYNEQKTNADGSITVTAAHYILHGPTAKGDLFFGQSTCGVTATSGGPTTTVAGGTTTTTRAGTTTTTAAPATTTTTAAPTTTTTQPVSVGGSAYGFFVHVAIFGGTPGIIGPMPHVSLPAGGSATPVTDSAAVGNGVFGPATFFAVGPITVSTQGTPTSTVKSSTSIQAQANQPADTCLNNATSCLYAGPFIANTAASNCTADASGVSGSTTFSGGELVTATDVNGNPTTIINVPNDPPPNDTINGSLMISAGDTETFTWVLNEQIHNANGSITVNAGHETLHGPTAVGESIFGDVTCARTVGATTAAATAAAAASGGDLPLSGAQLRGLLGVALMLMATGWLATRWAAGTWRRG
ncbi:MAG: hypothetical protein ACRDZ8_10390 [Acidimicrobiales bacterium]